MGSAGRAIGPDGKPLKQQPKRDNKNNQRGGGGNIRNQNRPGLGLNKPIQRFQGPRGPVPLLAGGIPPQQRMGPGGPPQFPIRMPFRGSGPDPSGSYGFFGAQMTDGGNGTAPAAVAPPAPNVAKVAQAPFSNQREKFTKVESAEARPGQPAAPQGAAPGGVPSSVGEVPGFGTNSSIHELFGKMVWRKMEGLRDQIVIDRLQNRIMNLIHDALSDQAIQQPGAAQPAPAMNGGFRAF